MSYPLTSIIIPSRNNVQFLERCVFSLYDTIDPNFTPYEIIVADENSIDGTKEFCELHKKHVKYLDGAKYNTFSSRNNFGVEHAKGEFFWFLNNDTEMLNDNLANMLKHFSNSEIGQVGSMHLFPNGELNHIGIAIRSDKHPDHVFPHEDPELPYINHGRFISIVTAASTIIPRKVFEEVGGFEEDYVWGYEDSDLSMKINEAGYKVYCSADAKMIHHAQSTRKTYDKQGTLDQKNFQTFLSKWEDKLDTTEFDRVYEEKNEYLRKQKSPGKLIKRGIKKTAKGTFNLVDSVIGADENDSGIKTPEKSDRYIYVSDSFTAFSNLADQLYRHSENTVKINTLEQINEIKDIPENGVSLFTTTHFQEEYFNTTPEWVRDYRSHAINYEKKDWSQNDYWTKSLLQPSRLNQVYLPISQFCADFLIKSGVPKERVEVLHLGHNPAVTETDFADNPKNTEKIVMFMVINTNDEVRYGTEKVVEAFELIKEKYPGKIEKVKLLVKDYGGKDRNALFLTDEYRKLRELGLEIEFINTFLSELDLMRLYYRSDFFVAPFRGEGFGMKIMDAAACGIPVICPNYGGPKDFLPDSCHIDVKFDMIPVGNGIDKDLLMLDDNYIWADVDGKDLGEKINHVVENIDSLKSEALKKREIIREKFSWNTIWNRFVEIDKKMQETYFAKEKKEYSIDDVNIILEKSTDAWKKLDNPKATLLINTINISNHLFKSFEHLEKVFDIEKDLDGEILIIDDASDEDPTEFLERFKEMPIHYVKYEKWGGTSKGKNVGIDLAKGDLIIITGDDIMPMPGFFKRHKLFAAEHSEPYIMQGHVEWDTHYRNNPLMEFTTKVTGFQFAYEMYRNWNEVDYLYTPNISFRKSDLMKNGGIYCPDINYFEDMAWGKKLKEEGFKVYYNRHACALHDHQMKSPLDWFINKSWNIVGYKGAYAYSYNPTEYDDVLSISEELERLGRIYGGIDEQDLKVYEKSFDIIENQFIEKYKEFEKYDEEIGFRKENRNAIYELLTEFTNFERFYGIAKYMNSDDSIAKAVAFVRYQHFLIDRKECLDHGGFKESFRWFLKHARKRFPFIFEPIYKVGVFLRKFI